MSTVAEAMLVGLGIGLVAGWVLRAKATKTRQRLARKAGRVIRGK